MTPLGIRNNNPGNLRAGHIPWVGQYAVDSYGFCIFASATEGIRALAKDLLAYEDRDNLTSIREFISRWAPIGENNTLAYIAAVCKACDWNPDTTYELHNPANLNSIVRAVIWHENGQNPYSADTIALALQEALSGETLNSNPQQAS